MDVAFIFLGCLFWLTLAGMAQGCARIGGPRK